MTINVIPLTSGIFEIRSKNKNIIQYIHDNLAEHYINESAPGEIREIFDGCWAMFIQKYHLESILMFYAFSAGTEDEDNED